jgi:hypothetical protein
MNSDDFFFEWSNDRSHHSGIRGEGDEFGREPFMIVGVVSDEAEPRRTANYPDHLCPAQLLEAIYRRSHNRFSMV